MFNSGNRYRESGRDTTLKVKHAEHDPNTNLSNLRFAVDILLFSGSLKHATTMLDDLTTTTTRTACNCNLRENPNHLQYDIKAREATVNIEILPPEGKTQILLSTHHLQKRRGQVEFERPHHMRVGNIHEPQARVEVHQSG